MIFWKNVVSKEIEIWQFVAERLRKNESVMLLVVAESSGSSPGRQGFKMVVAEDEMRGSIGGGIMETGLVQSAKCKVQSVRHKPENLNSQSEIVEQVHRKDAPNASGMICSGKQTVISFSLEVSHLETILKIIKALEGNQSKALQISNTGLQVLENASPDFDFRFERAGADDFVYEEKLGYKNQLFIVGGGHCALALSELMSKMDFYIELFDDRPDLNTLAKNEFANRKTILDSYEKIDEFIESGKNVYVVVMTIGYKFDELVIRRLIEKDFKYFGVLGSRAKMTTLLKSLLAEGCDEERLKRIRTPVGLEINSRTPEEIAISIAAEIIAVKNVKEVESRRNKN